MSSSTTNSRAVDLSPAQFPFTVQLLDTLTDELLWEATVTGPGVLPVPALGRVCSALVIGPDGIVVREDPKP